LDIKNTLKAIKLNESAISMVLGAVIVIIVGILLYNFFSTSDQGETIPAAETERLSDETNVEPEVGGIYIVKKGETLWEIAEQAYGSGYDWRQIAEANEITLGGSISEGQEILIPTGTVIAVEEPEIPEVEVVDELAKQIEDNPELIAEVDQQTDQVTISATEEEKNAEVISDTDSVVEIENISSESIDGDKYTVQKGDTLWEISVRAYGDGYKWVEIAEANDLANPDLIHRGNEFVLPR